LSWVHGVSPELGVRPLLAGLPAGANAFYHVLHAATEGIANCAEALTASRRWQTCRRLAGIVDLFIRFIRFI
jgi:hypothetical protein